MPYLLLLTRHRLYPRKRARTEAMGTMVQNLSLTTAAAAAGATMMILGHQHHFTDPILRQEMAKKERIARTSYLLMMNHLMMVVLTDPGARGGHTAREVREDRGIRPVQVLESRL